MKIKILELFGGIGACSKAFDKLGIPYEIVDYVEIDKHAVDSFNAIHNTDYQPQNITEWDKDVDVDLIMHGSPCQDFSLAGKQAGGDKDSGTRSSLMYETIRIVEKLKPKIVIWENVKNLISKKHKHNFDAYLEKLKNLGYTNYYQVLNAKDYGIPQNRERIFTISILDNYTENNKKISFFVKKFKFPDKQELKLKLKDMLEDSVDESFYLSKEKIERISHWKSYQKPFEKVNGNNSIVPTLTARGAGEEHSGMITYSDKLDNTTNLQEDIHMKKETENYIEWYEKGRFESECRAYKEDKVVGTITSSHDKKVLLKEELCNRLIEKELVKENDVIRHSYSSNRLKEWDKRNVETNNYVPTLDTRCDCLGVAVRIKNATNKGYLEATPGDGVDISSRMEYHRGNVQKQSIQTIDCTGGEGHGVVTNDLRIRKLTPKECWRLMGFEDEDYDKASKVNSKSQLYKQAGNSIVVNVLEEIIKQLIEMEN